MFILRLQDVTKTRLTIPPLLGCSYDRPRACILRLMHQGQASLICKLHATQSKITIQRWVASSRSLIDMNVVAIFHKRDAYQLLFARFEQWGFPISLSRSTLTLKEKVFCCTKYTCQEQWCEPGLPVTLHYREHSLGALNNPKCTY